MSVSTRPSGDLHPDASPFAQIARRALAARTALGLSQSDLAERAGVSRPTVIGMELGRPLRMDTLQRILDVLGLELRAVMARDRSQG